MKWPALFFLIVAGFRTQNVVAQTNLSSTAIHSSAQIASTNFADAEIQERLRATCINGRRFICGKILKVLPEGLVVDSGYTNLLRQPLLKTWLVSGTVAASKAVSMTEDNMPGSICVGIVFLTDYPQSTGNQPKLYDYVILEGYPAGKYTFESVGAVKKNVRRFSAGLAEAIKINLSDQNK